MRNLISLILFGLLLSCSPVPNAITNEYQLTAFTDNQLSSHKPPHSILITLPEAAAGFTSNEMLYTQKPYELKSFAHNAWVSAPNTMLQPLISQSLQKSGLFYAVASNTTGVEADYRLDSQLIELKQDFMKKPSRLDLTVKVTLVRQHDDTVLSSAVIHESIPCPKETPYGGVLAANQATRQLTAKIRTFVTKTIL